MGWPLLEATPAYTYRHPGPQVSSYGFPRRSVGQVPPPKGTPLRQVTHALSTRSLLLPGEGNGLQNTIAILISEKVSWTLISGMGEVWYKHGTSMVHGTLL